MVAGDLTRKARAKRAHFIQKSFSMHFHQSLVESKGVHVHLEDKTSGIVYWDADYKLPLLDPLVNLVGKTRLKKFAQAENFADSFYKPCVEKDDMQPHFYDLTIRTNGKFWDEDLQEFRPNTGFERGRMPVAHIGFEVQRFPQILKGKEKMGEWRKPGDSYANPGIGEPDPALRAIYDEEDPFYDPVKGKTFRGYYGDIIEKGGRTKDTFGYLFNYGPNPLLLDPPEWKTIEAAAKKMSWCKKNRCRDEIRIPREFHLICASAVIRRTFSKSASCAHVCEESPLDRLFLRGCQPFFG